MRLLSRYFLRQLVAPFCFALAALTSLMLLNQVAKRFGALVGKGLPWSVIAEVFVLSLPFITAMTLPMAVLLAVLYTFTHLAADNEVTALRATGISVPQLLVPVLAWGAVMAACNFAFVDQLLPRSNARLRALLIDIGRKRPTFELREQVINEVPPSKYFLRASRIDASTGRLRGVTIYDMAEASQRRVIYADSGVMAYAPNGRDLTLLLYDGTMHEYRATEPGQFQVMNFRANAIRVRNVFDELERNTSDQIRGDREMSSCELLAVVRDAKRDQRQAERERRTMLVRDLRELLALPPAPLDTSQVSEPQDYCTWIERIRAWLAPSAVTAQDSQPSPGAQTLGPARPASMPPVPSAATSAFQTLARELGLLRSADSAATGTPPASPARLTQWSDIAFAADRAKDARFRANRYLVEIHKKWAISVACICFVFLGIAMALRFPRGGMGLVIGGGLAAFSIYYVGLTAGEALADRGLIAPALAMWAPNLILTAVGISGLTWVNRQPGLNRGGDFQELWDAIRYRLRRRRARP